jgi:hypothetical protein
VVLGHKSESNGVTNLGSQLRGVVSETAILANDNGEVLGSGESEQRRNSSGDSEETHFENKKNEE